MKIKSLFNYTAIAVLFSILLFSCATTQDKPAAEVTSPEDDEVIVIDEDVQEYIHQEEVVEVLEAEDELTDDEYLRSIADLDKDSAVSKQEFTDDKHEILQIISELAIIMETKNTLEWLNYIEDESKVYYKNPVNLRKAQRKLRNKLIELKTIEDYFLYVFIEARRNKSIDEIRYVSRTKVKAVQVREDTDVVYYEFVKENGKWKVYLPPVS